MALVDQVQIRHFLLFFLKNGCLIKRDHKNDPSTRVTTCILSGYFKCKQGLKKCAASVHIAKNAVLKFLTRTANEKRCVTNLTKKLLIEILLNIYIDCEQFRIE